LGLDGGIKMSFPLEPNWPSRVAFEEVKFFSDEDVLARVAEGFDRGQAEVGGEFAEFGFEGVEAFEFVFGQGVLLW
jgi:hypothetical protein